MGFYIRKSFKIGPLRLNLSKSGLGASMGVKGARLGLSSKGKIYVHLGRGGLYTRQDLGSFKLQPATSSRGIGFWILIALAVVTAADRLDLFDQKGRRDGFAALVNYHRLDRKCLERLAYTYLGDWIEDQRRGAKAGEIGAEERLAAALELQKRLVLILEGEPPHDIFVRWKPIEKQPIGWEPDPNDGVRANIRSFVEAGVLRKSPRIHWKKDRGREPERQREQYPWFWEEGEFTGERVNDVHLSHAEKRAARTAGERSC